MYRHLSNGERAPVGHVIKILANAGCSYRDAYSDFATNCAMIGVLHAHGWRKREYVQALRARERNAAQLQKLIRQRAINKITFSSTNAAR